MSLAGTSDVQPFDGRRMQGPAQHMPWLMQVGQTLKT